MKRAVVMVIDGLRADMIGDAFTPRLAAVAERSRWFTDQRSVFPSATRVNSASIATGCWPKSHGLAGNAVALDEGNGLVAVSVGPPEFRERLRRVTGRTLHRPTLTEHLRPHGGAVIYSNSSPGSAHMQDPDSHGWLFHRSGSFAPGMEPITDGRHLDVTYDAAGDAETTRRFCEALGCPGEALLHLLWICEPDHSQHTMELGSPEHREIVAGAEECLDRVNDAVESLRAKGDDVLFVIASDHGQESVDAIIPVRDLLIEAGFKGQLYPVNPKATEIEGLAVVNDISELPRGLDVGVGRYGVLQLVHMWNQYRVHHLVHLARPGFAFHEHHGIKHTGQ